MRSYLSFSLRSAGTQVKYQGTKYFRVLPQRYRSGIIAQRLCSKVVSVTYVVLVIIVPSLGMVCGTPLRMETVL